MGKLSAAGITGKLKNPGRYSDGDGLILNVWKPGRGAWVARLQANGKRRDYGLGTANDIGLTEARERCRAYRKALREGRDPKTLDETPEDAMRLFRDVATEFVKAKLSAKRRSRELGRLQNHAFPKLGGLQLQSITVERVTECLKPIWTTKPETARKVRAYIVRTLRYGLPNGAAVTAGLAQAVSDRLPEQPKGKNFPAVHYADVPDLMHKLSNKGGMGALALRLAILCVNRAEEVRGAKWSEIDFDAAVWTIPGERMKMKRKHRVPLSEEAIAVLREAAAVRRAGTDLVFPSIRDGWLSDGTMNKVLHDLGYAETQHGMRASFRTWTGEQTRFPDEIAAACQAHQVSGDVRRRYLRTDFFDERRKLMAAWGRYCAGRGGAEVVQLHRA